MATFSFFICIMIFLSLILFICFFRTPGKCILAGVVACIAAAFTVCGSLSAATIEERIEQYRESHFDMPSEYIFIGDSRTVGMQSFAQGSGNDIWSCKKAAGYDWMVSEGIPAVEGQISEDTAVFILLGINDLAHSQAYADYINSKAASWEGRTYFVSVGPVGNTTVTNTQIESFNSVLKDNAEHYEYLDLYGSMVQDGFGTWDGLHYTPDTCQYIYNFLKDAV